MAERVSVGDHGVELWLLSGSLPREVSEDICSVAPSEARRFVRRVMGVLRRHGYSVRREVPVPNRGDGRSGRVDIVATCDGSTVAIEVDRCAPRGKSLVKLSWFPDEVTCAIVLREPRGEWPERLLC